MGSIPTNEQQLRHDLFAAVDHYLKTSEREWSVDSRSVTKAIDTLATLQGMLIYLLIGHNHECLSQVLTILERNIARGYRVAREMEREPAVEPASVRRHAH